MQQTSSPHDSTESPIIWQSPVQSETVALNESHDTHHHHDSAIAKALRYAGIGSAAIAVSPIALKQFGVGEESYKIMLDKCCPFAAQGGWKVAEKNGTSYFGVAGAITRALEEIPLLGTSVTRSGIHNALTAGGIIIVGHYAGSGLEQLQKRVARDNGSNEEAAGSAGRTLKTGSNVLGIVFAMPSILPGIGHSLQCLSGMVGLESFHPRYDGTGSVYGGESMWRNLPTNLDAAVEAGKPHAVGPMSTVAKILGKMPGACRKEDKMWHSGQGAGVLLLSQLCCALPVLIPVIADWLTVEKDAPKNQIHAAEAEREALASAASISIASS